MHDASRLATGKGGGGVCAFSMDNQTDKDCIIRRVWHTKKGEKKREKKKKSKKKAQVLAHTLRLTVKSFHICT